MLSMLLYRLWSLWATYINGFSVLAPALVGLLVEIKRLRSG
jgi:hypothetical protein